MLTIMVLMLEFGCLRFDKSRKMGGPKGYFFWLIIGYGVGEFFCNMFLLKAETLSTTPPPPPPPICFNSPSIALVMELCYLYA